jgi:hypothetical protein
MGRFALRLLLKFSTADLPIFGPSGLTPFLHSKGCENSLGLLRSILLPPQL